MYELAFVNRAPKVDLTPKIRLPRAPSGRGLRPNCVLVRVERGHGEVPCAHVPRTDASGEFTFLLQTARSRMLSKLGSYAKQFGLAADFFSSLRHAHEIEELRGIRI